jgi:excisionase family DNA binding protein
MIGGLISWTQCPGAEPAPKEEITEEYLTTRQAAERLRSSTRVVYRLLAKGKLSGTKIGFRWQIPVAVLKDYIKAAPVTRRTTTN